MLTRAKVRYCRRHHQTVCTDCGKVLAKCGCLLVTDYYVIGSICDTCMKRALQKAGAESTERIEAAP